MELNNNLIELNEIINMYESIEDQHTHEILISYMMDKINKLVCTLDEKYYKHVIKNKNINELTNIREKSIVSTQNTIRDFFPYMMLHIMNQITNNE